MSSTLNELRDSFRRHDVVVKLVYVNCAVFLILRLADVLALFGVARVGWLVHWVAMPLGYDLLARPWTLLTNIVAHYDLVHFLLNLLCLYWFGQLFMRVFNSDRRALLCYVVGGVAGSLTAMVGLLWWFGGHLLGASGAILALLLAATAAKPDLQVWVTFFGNVRLKYISLIYVLLSVVGVVGLTGNMGGNLAHLGGAVAGLALGRLWAKRPDPNPDLASLFSPRRRKPKMKPTFDSNPDWSFNAAKSANEKEIDRILEKVKRTGYNSLSADEKRQLFDQSNR